MSPIPILKSGIGWIGKRLRGDQTHIHDQSPSQVTVEVHLHHPAEIVENECRHPYGAHECKLQNRTRRKSTRPNSKTTSDDVSDIVEHPKPGPSVASPPEY